MIDLGVNLFLILAALLILPYVLGPVLVYLTVSMPGKYDLEEIPWETFIGERSRNFLDLHNQLLDLGFDPVGASHIKSSHGKTYFSLYRHPERPATASLITAESALGPEILVADFTQRYADDFYLTVNNMKDASILPESKRRKVYRFADEADPASLYVKFNRIIYGLGRHDTAELPAGREFEYLSKSVEDEMLGMVSTGIARLSTSDGKLRFTFRSSCISTWKMLWPLKGILRRKDLEIAALASKGF